MSNCTFRYNGHKCQHPKYESHDHCVFHVKGASEKTADFIPALEALIRGAEDRGNDMVDMRGFVFPAVEFTDRDFKLNLQFQASHFDGPVVFNDSRFIGHVDFTDCTFHDATKFQNCQFHQDFWARKANFLKTCDFSSARFFSEASYSTAKFSGGGNFRYAEFMDKASFRKAKFHDDADFKQIESKQELDFRECEFKAEANLSHSRIEKFLSIREGDFGGPCLFKNAHIDGVVSAENSVFRRGCNVSGAVFRSEVDFSNGEFFEELDLSHSKFETEAQFNGARFLWRATLNSGVFLGRMSFHNCVFEGSLFARECDFSQPCEFQGARFHNEIDFSRSRFAYLKNVVTDRGVRLDQTVLEDSHFWGTDVLNGYSFRDAFLLSLNLSNKQINNCDFTGAVVSGVNTRNWRLDEQTKRNTRFVYSNYRTRSIKEGDDSLGLYEIDTDSRVPADGDFGVGEHRDYTLEDYLKSLCVWSLSLQVPPMLRKAYLDYINFFSDYARATEMVNVEIRTKKEGRKLRVEFVTDDEEQKKIIQDAFPRYLDSARSQYPQDLNVLIRDPDITPEEREALVRDFQLEIHNLHTRLDSKIELLESKEGEHWALLENIKQLQNNPPAALRSHPIKTEENICIIHIDIDDYSGVTKKESAAYPAINGLLGKILDEVRNDRDFEGISSLSDGLQFYVRTPDSGAFITKDILNDIGRFNRQKDGLIPGVRAILGFGLLYVEQNGDLRSFSGKAIVDTVRLDQPIKQYIANVEPNAKFAIWCTQAYFERMQGEDSNIAFESIGKIELDKGYGRALAYRVRTS